MENKTFGETLKELRVSNGMKSQRQLALKTGIATSTISRLENNTQKPEPSTLKILSQHLLNSSYEELLELAGYIGTPDENDKILSAREQELIIKSRKLSDDQIDLVLRLMDEMI